MESKFKSFVNENKKIIVFYILWIFLHSIFLVNGDDESGFWPFGNDGFELDDYGLIDFIYYIIIPPMIFVIWKLIGKDIKKSINENK